MTKINKKSTMILLLLLFLITLTTISYAAPFTDIFTDGLISINNFFEGQYEPYSKAIDFFFFALLFISVYMIGARYAFKEVKRPEKVIVLLLGLMTAFLLVLGDFSVTLLLPYIHWILYLLLFLLYWWLLKGIKSKFWRFVLALLLTILTIALMQGLFDYLKKPEIPEIGTPELGGIGEFFRSLGESFTGIDLGITAPGLPDWAREVPQLPSVPTPPGGVPPTPTPTPTPTPAPTPTPEEGFPWGTILPILLLILLLALGIWKRKGIGELVGDKFKREKKKEEKAPELTIDDIIKKIIEIIEKKKDILKRIQDIITEKNNLTWELRDLYYKTIKKFDKAFFLDPDSAARQNFDKQDKIVYDLIKNEVKLERELEDLQKLEKELLGYDIKGMIEIPFTGKTKVLRYGLVFKWLELIAKLSHEQIERLDKEIKESRGTPLLLREKLVAFIRSIIVEFPAQHRQQVERVVDIIADLISSYQWSPEELALRFRDPINMRGENKLVSDYLRDENGDLMRNPEGSVITYEVLDTNGIELMQKNAAICDYVLRHINYYFLLARDEKFRQKTWQKLISIKNMKKWLNNVDRWRDIRRKIFGDPDREPVDMLRAHFEYETRFFVARFRPAVIKQMQHMYTLMKHLKYMKELPEDVVMQPLRIEYVNDAGQTVQLSDAEARTASIPRDKLIRVFCRLEQGKGPFKLGCYVDGKAIRSNQLVRGSTDRYYPRAEPIEQTEGHPLLEWKSEMFIDRFGDTLTPGNHEITFYLASKLSQEEANLAREGKQPIYRKFRDVKSIKIYIKGTTPEYPPLEYPPHEYPPVEYPPLEYPPHEYPPVEYPKPRRTPEEYPSEEYPPTRVTAVTGRPIEEYPPSLDLIMKDVSEGGRLYNHFNFFRENIKIQISKRAFSSIKVLHLSIPTSIKAGVVTSVNNLFKYQNEYGMNLELITHWWGSAYSFFGYINKSSIVNKNDLSSILVYGSFIPDIIHVHTHTFEYDGALKVIKEAFPTAPLIYTLHQLIPHAYMSPSERQRLEEAQEETSLEVIDKYYSESLWGGHAKSQKDTIEVSDGIVAISNSQLQFFKRLFKGYKGESIPIENGVDFFKFINNPKVDQKAFELLSKYNLFGQRLILFVGRIEEVKGYKRVIQAFLRILKSEKYKNSKLIFVGGYIPKIEKKILNEGVSDNILNEHIILIPWTIDNLELAAWYRIGTVLVNPMKTDNLYSMVAKEAICMGLPTIACKGEMSIGQSKSDDDIYKALIYIFENSKRVKAHILKAFEICMAYHSVYNSVEQHLEFYNDLIRKKSTEAKVAPITESVAEIKPPKHVSTPISKSVPEEKREVLEAYGGKPILEGSKPKATTFADIEEIDELRQAIEIMKAGGLEGTTSYQKAIEELDALLRSKSMTPPESPTKITPEQEAELFSKLGIKTRKKAQ